MSQMCLQDKRQLKLQWCVLSMSLQFLLCRDTRHTAKGTYWTLSSLEAACVSLLLLLLHLIWFDENTGLVIISFCWCHLVTLVRKFCLKNLIVHKLEIVNMFIVKTNCMIISQTEPRIFFSVLLFFYGIIAALRYCFYKCWMFVAMLIRAKNDCKQDTRDSV